MFLAAWLAVTMVMASPAAIDSQAALRIEEKPSLSIGMVDGPDGYLFEFIVSAAFRPDGGVAVADRGTHTVRFFDSDGALIAESGGEGGGPSEFRYLDRLWTRGDTVLVYDPMAAKVVRFDGQGRFLRTDPFPFPMTAYLGDAPGGGIWLSRMAGVEPGAHGLAQHLNVIERYREEEAVATIDGLRGLLRHDGSPHAFGLGLQAVLTGDSVVILDPVAAELHLYSPRGRLARRIEVPAARTAFDDAVDAVEREINSREIRGAPPDLNRRLRRLPEIEVPRLSHMLADDRGRIWVKQYDPAEDAHWVGGWAGPEGGTWWVVDLGSGRSTAVAMPIGVHPLAIRGQDILGRHTDEMGVQRVVVHRIRGLDARTRGAER